MARKAHFSPALFAFLRELRLHNQREWFERVVTRETEFFVRHLGEATR